MKNNVTKYNLPDYKEWATNGLIARNEVNNKIFERLVFFVKSSHRIGQMLKKQRGNGLKKRKLNYRIHNPNPEDVTADFLLKLFVEVNAKKVEKIIREEALFAEVTDRYIARKNEEGKVLLCE